MTEHFLTLESLGPGGVREILDLSHRFKREPGRHREALAGGRVGMIFDKPSTRTRVSLEDAAWALGMLPIVMRPDELQLGHGETVADTARVLSRYLSALTIRTFAHARVEELAAHSTIPIINALTDEHHPCQALADVMTLEEAFGDLRGRRVAFIGDGNNVAHSLIEAAGYLGFTLVVATPEGYRPDPAIVAGRASPRHGERRRDRAGDRSPRGRPRLGLRLHGRLGVHGQGARAGGAPPGLRRLHGRRGDDGGRRPRGDLPPLPAGASRRRGDRRGHGRARRAGSGTRPRTGSTPSRRSCTR